MMKDRASSKLARGARQESRRFRLLVIVVGFFLVTLTFVVVSKPDAILFGLNGKLPADEAATPIVIQQKVDKPPVVAAKKTRSTDALGGDPKVVDDEADVKPKGIGGGEEEEDRKVLSEPDPASGMVEPTHSKDGHKSDLEMLGGGDEEKHRVTLPTVSNYTIHDAAEDTQIVARQQQGMATQPNKANDGEGVNYSKIWANAMEVVEKRKEAEEERKRKEAEEERKMKEAEEEKRRKAFEEVVQLARDLAKKKDEEDEVNKKKEEEEMNRKKKKEEEERKRQKEKEEEERNRRANARPPCVDQEERPCKAFRTDEAHGKEVPICWCGTDCTVKESLDYYSDSWGKKFFMCANYNRSPVRSRNPYDTPPSPPPVCRYYTWIDLEQPQSNKAIQEIDFAIRRSRYQERPRDEDMARKRKERNDEICKKEEEEERQAKEDRAAERERLRQAAWRSMEEEEEKKRKGKGPML